MKATINHNNAHVQHHQHVPNISSVLPICPDEQFVSLKLLIKILPKCFGKSHIYIKDQLQYYSQYFYLNHDIILKQTFVQLSCDRTQVIRISKQQIYENIDQSDSFTVEIDLTSCCYNELCIYLYNFDFR